MALTLNIIEGFEKNSNFVLAEVVNGTPSIVGSPVFTGNGAMLCATSGDGIEIATTIAANMFGSGRNQGLRVRFASVSAAQVFTKIQDNVGVTLCALGISATGYFQILDSTDTVVGTGTTPLAVDTWYHLEWYFENNVAGLAALDLDGSREITIAGGEDFDGLALYAVLESDTNNDIWFDDYYLISDSGGVVNFIGSTHGVLAYQNTVEDATDQGDTLDSGTWGNMGETPENLSNQGIYSGTPKTGYTRMDEGARAGPLTDLMGGQAYGGFWVWRASRGGGGSATHTFRYGAYDGVTDQILESNVTLETSPKTYARSSVNWTYIPSDAINGDEYFCQGGKVVGARSFECQEMWACFLHATPPSAVPVNKDQTFQWDIFELVNKDQALQWDIAELVYKDLALVWDMAGAVSNDLTLVWDILNLINKDQQFQWDILSLINKDQTFQWDIAELVSKDLTLVWDMNELVYKDLQLIWDIFTFNPVYKDLLLRWSIRRIEREGPHFLGFKVIVP